MFIKKDKFTINCISVYYYNSNYNQIIKYSYTFFKLTSIT